MLQIICGCGRIAEVRHKRTGQNLAYTHCIECGTDLGSIKKAAVVEAAAMENIGVKGEFPNDTSKNSVSTQENITENFKPAPEDLPENVEPDIIKTETENKDKPVKSMGAIKFFVGFLVTAALGGGVYQMTKSKG